MGITKLLQAGDKVTAEQYGAIRIMEVERVTPTTAILDNGNKLRREYTEGKDIDRIADQYGPSYTVTTQADLDAVALNKTRNILRTRMEKTSGKLSAADCQAILEILNRY